MNMQTTFLTDEATLVVPENRAGMFVPADIKNIQRLRNGPVRFDMELPLGAEYLVQASTDLQAWHPIGAGTAEQVQLEFVDSEAFKFNHRFYRVIADETPSTAVLGYASTVVPPGISMIANPFVGGGSVEDLLRGWPDGTTLSRFDTRLARINDNGVARGRWTHPTERLEPGEGAIFFNPTHDYRTISFLGEVEEGDFTTVLPAGFSVRSSLVPRFGRLQEDLMFPVADGYVIHLFDRDRQSYVLYPFENGQWRNGCPIISLCEAFWVAKSADSSWRQTLDIPAYRA